MKDERPGIGMVGAAFAVALLILLALAMWPAGGMKGYRRYPRHR